MIQYAATASTGNASQVVTCYVLPRTQPQWQFLQGTYKNGRYTKYNAEDTLITT